MEHPDLMQLAHDHMSGPSRLAQLSAANERAQDTEMDEAADILFSALDMLREYRLWLPLAEPVETWDGPLARNIRMLSYLAEFLPVEYSQWWSRNYGPAR